MIRRRTLAVVEETDVVRCSTPSSPSCKNGVTCVLRLIPRKLELVELPRSFRSLPLRSRLFFFVAIGLPPSVFLFLFLFFSISLCLLFWFLFLFLPFLFFPCKSGRKRRELAAAHAAVLGRATNGNNHSTGGAGADGIAAGQGRKQEETRLRAALILANAEHFKSWIMVFKVNAVCYCVTTSTADDG